MNDKEIISALEAVLFASGEPISKKRIAETLEIEERDVDKYADALSSRLCARDSGLCVLKLENTYQMSTKKDFAEYIRRAFDIKRKTPLSPAAMEVLAVISYNQPVTRAFVEQVRGVDCSGVIQTLVEKELIEERGRLELPGRPLLYGTTKTFLRCFSMSDLSELPPLPKEEGAAQDLGEQLTIDTPEAEQPAPEDTGA